MNRHQDQSQNVCQSRNRHTPAPDARSLADEATPRPPAGQTRSRVRHQATLGRPPPRSGLDRTLIWNQRQLLHALPKFKQFYNGHRPHQGVANALPSHPLPAPVTDPDKINLLDIRRRDHHDGVLHESEYAAHLHGRNFRHAQGSDRQKRLHQRPLVIAQLTPCHGPAIPVRHGL